MAYDFVADTYFLPDYNGDLSNADDNIVEITLDGTILNAWEMDDEVGSNDSSDGSEIDSILDIAVVPGAPPRYFVTASYDGSIMYEVVLTKTGTWWTPNSWATVMTCTVPGLTDNLGIDYDAEHELLYHSGWHTDTIVVTDLSCSVVETFRCPSDAGYQSGITKIEGTDPQEAWATNFTDDETTRCEAPGTATGIDWDKSVNGEAWTPDLEVTSETSDTIQVVDVLTAARGASLIEQWDPAKLELLNWATSPIVGTIITGTGSLRWDMPPFPTVMTMTKWFHVLPCTWTHGLLHEEFLVDGVSWQERSVGVHKAPADLWVEAVPQEGEPPIDAFAGETVTFQVSYGNAGGYESRAWITATFPAEMPFAGADPPPTGQDPQGRWAWWNLGNLGRDEGGSVSVSVEVSPDLSPYAALHAYSYIYDHVDVERDWSPITTTVKPVEPTWEKAVWINGNGPLAPEDGPYAVFPGDGVRVIDRVHVTAAAPVSLTVSEGWSGALMLSDWEISGGAVEESVGALTWHGPSLAANAWHSLTKTFVATGGEWAGGVLRETLRVAAADPVEYVREVRFNRNGRLFLPLVMRP